MTNKSRLYFIPQSSSSDGVNVDYYVSQIGSDSAAGTRTAPFATVEHAEGLIPPVLNGSQYRIHLTSGSHLLPARGSFLRSRLLQNGSRIEVFADEDWDPSVVTVIATGTADAGTTASVVKAAGLTDEQYQDYTLEIETVGGVPVPLAQRERRHIRNNTATDIVPVDGFFNAPTPGDTYRILQLNCALTAPTLPAPPKREYILVEDCPSGTITEFAAISYFFGSTEPAVSPAGIVLRGVNAKISASFTEGFVFGRAQVFAFGLERPVDDPPFGNFFELNGTMMFAGCGLPQFKNLSGWGVKMSQKNMSDVGRTSLDPGNAAIFFGYLQEALADSIQNADEALNTTVTILGGVTRRFFDPISRILIFGGLITGTPYLVQVPAGNRMATLDGFGVFLDLSGVEVVNEPGSLGGCCRVRGDDTLILNSNTVGQPVPGNFVEAGSGGRILIYLFGSPLQFGDPVAADYKVQGVAPVNRSFFVNPGDSLVGTDGSLITVVE